MTSLFKQMLKDFNKYASTFLKIKDKSARIIPLKLNSPQQRILDIYLEAKKSGKPLRFIVLKARQEGVSTLFEAIIFVRTSLYSNHKAVIVGHEVDSANNLFEMVKRFYRHLPPEIQPEIEHSNEKKLSFKKLGSEIRIASADAGMGLKRSDTIQDLHCTEVAFWRAQKEGLLALLQAVPDNSETLVILESTANGLGGEFYNRWKDAMEGRSEYIPIFLAWFDLPEYLKPFADENEKKALKESITQEETQLSKTYRLTSEHLNWRRFTITNKCGGDPELFKQEYPSNDQEAFIVSGSPVFDTNICVSQFERAKGPVKVGKLEYVNSDKSEVTFVQDAKGFIRQLEQLDHINGDQYRFAAGCDVAEGLEQGDYSAIRILDRKTNVVAAVWHGHIDPDLLAEEQHKIQIWLAGDVYFCTERNNHGLTTITSAFHKNVKQYYDIDFSKGYEIATDRLGFRTTEFSKPMIINILNQAIREGNFQDGEKEFWQETLTFVRNSKGRMQAQNKDTDPGTKCYDDRVIAEALMLRCHQWLPPYKQTPKQLTAKEKWELQKTNPRTRDQAYPEARLVTKDWRTNWL